MQGKNYYPDPRLQSLVEGIGTWYNLGQWDCTLNFPEICKERYHLSSENLPDSFPYIHTSNADKRSSQPGVVTAMGHILRKTKRTQLKRNKIPDDWSAGSQSHRAHLALAFQLYTLIKSRCYLSQFNLIFLLLAADLTLTDTSTMWYDVVYVLSVLRNKKDELSNLMWPKNTPLVSDEAEHRVLWLQSQCSSHCNILPPWCGPRNSLFRLWFHSLNSNILKLYNQNENVECWFKIVFKVAVFVC